MIWMTFRRHSGLYFYSLLASSWGIFIYALAFLMKFFQVWTNNYVSVALITVGWYAMVTGQSLVLYSRLHLVVRDLRKIRWVLYMIIIDVFLFHFPNHCPDFRGSYYSNLNQTTYYTNNYHRPIRPWQTYLTIHTQLWKRSKSQLSPSKNSSFPVSTCTKRGVSYNPAPASKRNARAKSCSTSSTSTSSSSSWTSLSCAWNMLISTRSKSPSKAPSTASNCAWSSLCLTP